MKAIRIHHYGPASELTLEDVALPHYTGNDVLIRVAASGVNPLTGRSAPASWRKPCPIPCR